MLYIYIYYIQYTRVIYTSLEVGQQQCFSQLRDAAERTQYTTEPRNIFGVLCIFDLLPQLAKGSISFSYFLHHLYPWMLCRRQKFFASKPRSELPFSSACQQVHSIVAILKNTKNTECPWCLSICKPILLCWTSTCKHKPVLTLATNKCLSASPTVCF